ncbi:MAG: L-serine ammonia-lyase [Spirochaetia bacterium]|nr:L-serine ammonia-lyase [Spirochaetia bacterium]
MSVSVFQLFSIGIGPSSSHTVGPMRAARSFLLGLDDLESIESLAVELYGSLAMTGKGHGTDTAILLGLSGFSPETVDPEAVAGILQTIRSSGNVRLLGKKSIPFRESEQLVFLKTKALPFHSNGMRFTALNKNGASESKVFYSVGGGFVVEEGKEKILENAASTFPHPFATAEELLALVKNTNKSIPQIVLENELVLRSENEVRSGILAIWHVMEACVERGLRSEGILPGGLQIKRRAPALYLSLTQHGLPADPAELMEWVSVFALAVNEENAAGGRVVTAPTNGASGVIPAVLHYYKKFVPSFHEDGIIQFFLTATAIGTLYKLGASLSAAEMGCQGEVGVACSMAAAGLCAALGGSDAQVENAAEIGMEHNLGLTCDPIGGLVQVPCIERNTMGAIKAINAARLALRGDGLHRVSLDQVIRAMRETGENMKTRYKETAEGGLAAQVSVNQVEC